MYYFTIIEKTTDWFSRLAIASIPLFCIMVMLWIILLLNYGDQIKKWFVVKPISGIDQALKENNLIGHVVRGTIGFVLNILIILLLTLIPPESYGNILPFGDLMPLSETLEALSQLIQSMFQSSSITIPPGDKFLLSMMGLFSVLASGPITMFALRQIRQNKLANLFQDNKNEKFTSSKSVLIFVYASLPIILFRLTKLNVDQLSNLGWFPTFLFISFIFTVSAVLIEPFAFSRLRKQSVRD